MKNDNVRPKNRRKRTQDVRGTSKAHNRQSKTSKKCRKLKEIQTNGESLQTQLERSVKLLLNVKATIEGFLKGLPNGRNICWFNSVMVSLMNTLGASRAIELPECRRNKMWYEFRQSVEFLNINTTKDKLDMKSHISAIENYLNGSPHFSLGRQEDAAKFFLVSSNFLDNNDEEFQSNAKIDTDGS